MRFRDRRKPPRRIARRFLWSQSRSCYWCGTRLVYGSDVRRGLQATRDHLIPRSEGGSGSAANIVAACAPCNNARGSDEDWVPNHQQNPRTVLPLSQRRHFLKRGLIGAS